jgi:hypothetical protein
MKGNEYALSGWEGGLPSSQRQTRPSAAGLLAHVPFQSRFIQGPLLAVRPVQLQAYWWRACWQTVVGWLRGRAPA